MIKTIVILFLLNIISRNIINAAYADQRCFICHDNGCDHPGNDNIKSCSDSGNSPGTSGKEFVAGALDKESEPYTALANDLNAFGLNFGINETLMPSWESLTRWVCYVSKTKRRGCLVMGKGLCDKDKSVLSKLTEIGSKLTNIMDKAKKSVAEMFSGAPNSNDLTLDQKTNISHWIAKNYMVNLINNTKDDDFKLDTCCEGNECNFASIIEKSTIVLFIALLLSTFILV